MELLARAAAEGKPVDLGALIAAVPYCAWLGVTARLEGDTVVLIMPFADKLVGNPVIPAGMLVKVKDLPSGGYRLVVQAVDDANNHAPNRTVDFDVSD